MELFVGNSLWHLVMQSDGISKTVLLLLLGMSIVCWTLFFIKAALFSLKKKQLNKTITALQLSSSIQDILHEATEAAGTLSGYFLSQNLSFLNKLLKANVSKILEETERDMMLYNLDQVVDKTVEEEKSYLPLLSTAAGVAPLLGLFGTVWGLIHSFMRISEKGVADITTVAPGIAEALLTTLAGLLVAIPALIMFNYLQVQIRTIENRLIVLADQVGVIVQQLTIRKHYAQTEASPQRSGDIDGHFTHSSY